MQKTGLNIVAPASEPGLLELLFLRLKEHDDLSAEEKQVLNASISQERGFAAGQDIVTAGSRPGHSSVLVEGFAARYKLLADGGRQITAIHITGDFVDLHAFLLKTMDHGVVALSPCRVAFCEHQSLQAITQAYPHLTRMLWLSTVVDGAIHREWIVAMGRRSKRGHLAHVLCELFVRLRSVQRVVGASFSFPLSQSGMADVLGLSVVHMNCVIQSLRREKLISWVGHTVTILDWERLQEVAEFDPTYLSMVREPR